MQLRYKYITVLCCFSQYYNQFNTTIIYFKSLRGKKRTSCKLILTFTTNNILTFYSASAANSSYCFELAKRDQIK